MKITVLVISALISASLTSIAKADGAKFEDLVSSIRAFADDNRSGCKVNLYDKTLEITQGETTLQVALYGETAYTKFWSNSYPGDFGRMIRTYTYQVLDGDKVAATLYKAPGQLTLSSYGKNVDCHQK